MKIDEFFIRYLREDYILIEVYEIKDQRPKKIGSGKVNLMVLLEKNQKYNKANNKCYVVNDILKIF